MKKILVINAHPNESSFCHAISKTYAEHARYAGYEVEEITLRQMQFSTNLAHGYEQRTEWEPDLIQAWKQLQAAEHWIIVYPTWWGAMPANLKGFFDRVFLPGMAFQYRKDSVWWDKLLKGKTAHIITTMDTPAWYYRWIYGNAGINVLKRNILEFCGVKVSKTTIISPMRDTSDETRRGYLGKVMQMAKLGI